MRSRFLALFLRHNRFVNQSPKLMRGTWSAYFPRILAQNDMQTDGVLMTSRCPKATYMLEEHCSFRDKGFFLGDGQSTLTERLTHNPCQKNEKDQSSKETSQ